MNAIRLRLGTHGPVFVGLDCRLGLLGSIIPPSPLRFRRFGRSVVVLGLDSSLGSDLHLSLVAPSLLLSFCPLPAPLNVPQEHRHKKEPTYRSRTNDYG